MARIRICLLTERPMEDDVADAVGLVNLCRNLNALPDPGSVLEQDSFTMFLFRFVITCQQERAELDARKTQGRP